jgi:hypothetical protein
LFKDVLYGPEARRTLGSGIRNSVFVSLEFRAHTSVSKEELLRFGVSCSWVTVQIEGEIVKVSLRDMVHVIEFMCSIRLYDPRDGAVLFPEYSFAFRHAMPSPHSISHSTLFLVLSQPFLNLVALSVIS